MERCQRAGDKSEEISVRTDNMDDSMLELASIDHNADDDGTVSDNDDNVSYGDDTLDDVEEEEEDDDDDDLAYSPQRAQRAHPRVEDGAETQDDSQGSDDEDDLSGYGGAEFHREEAESFMGDLIAMCEGTEHMGAEQHKDSLMQLNSKWQQILDQVMYDQEQHIESLVQERNETEMRSEAELNGLRQLHEEEIAAVKEEVMDQSQKIILQEMKVNAERERKYEEAFESRVEQAVDESKEQMSDEFDIALSGMKATQEEMEAKYKRMLKDTEIRVQDEVFRDASKASDSKVSVFMMQFEEMKTQVVDLTMDIQTLEMAADATAEDHASEITEKDTEIKKLKANIDKRISTSKMLISQMRNTHSSEIEQLQAKINELLSNEEQIEVDTSKHANVEEAHSEEIECLKKAHQLKIAEMQLTESKNIDKMQKTLNKLRKADTADFGKKLDEANASMAKYQSVIANREIEIAAVRKEHEESTQKLNKEHKSQLARLNAHCAQKIADADRSLIAEPKERFEALVETLQKKHKCEVHTLIQKQEDEKAVIVARYDSIGSEQGTKISSLQKQNNKFRLRLKAMEENESKKVTELEAKMSSLQEKNSQLKKLKSASTGQLKSNHAGKKSRNGDETPRASANMKNTSVIKSNPYSTKLNGKVNNARTDLLINGGDELEEQRKNGNTLPTEIQLKLEDSIVAQTHYETEEKERSLGKHHDAASNCSTLLSSGKSSPIYLPDNDAPPFPDISPITLGSPPPNRSYRRKISKVTPVTGEQELDLHTTPKQSPLLNSSKYSFRTQVAKTPTTVKSATLAVAPKSFRKMFTTPRRRRRDSLSSWGSSASLAEPHDMRLMILNIPVTTRLKKIINFLKIELIDDPLLATHVVAGDSSHPMRRTWKLMAAFCVTPRILKCEWLEESYKSKELLSYKRYLLLNDTLAESVYSFSMKSMLREGNERRRDGGLLAGWRILICSNVAGNKAPRETELLIMIGAAGGMTISRDDIPLPPTDDPTHVIVITSDPPLPAQLQDPKCQVAAGNGAGFFTSTWFF